VTAATQAAEVSDDILKWEGLPCPGDCFSCPPMWEEPLCSDCPENRRVAPPPTLTTSSGPNVGGAAGLRLPENRRVAPPPTLKQPPRQSAGGTASRVEAAASSAGRSGFGAFS